MEYEVIAIERKLFLLRLCRLSLLSWFFTYLLEVRHLDLKASAIYGMLPFIGMMTCSPLGGWIGDRLAASYGKRAGRCGIAVVALGTQVFSAPMARFVLAGGAGALYLSQSSWSAGAGLSGSSAGSVSGVMNMCGQFGGVLTASLTPWIAAHYGWTVSFIVAGAMAICGSLAWLAVDPSRELVLPKAPGVTPAAAASRQAGPRV